MARKSGGSASSRIPKKPSGAARTLLLRMWHESRRDAAGARIWRGTLSDVEGRRIGTFTTVTDLMEILGELAGTRVLLQFSREHLEGARSRSARASTE